VSRLQRTPLYEVHRRLGARMVEFAGFEMPVAYGSILAEHASVRERAGLFDVSHMGQLHLSGAGAVASAERLVSCPVASLRVGQVRYGLLCNEGGGVVDDVTVYRTGEESLFFCVNAANVEKDYRWMVRHAGADTAVRNRSAETGLLALQGPRAAAILERVAEKGTTALRRFRFGPFEVAGARVLVSRTGYTGSDGFELYVDAPAVENVFEALLEEGGPDGIRPVGLGARDTLRLEAALPLYGHELDDTTSPLEARLDRFVKRDLGGFIGAEAIERRAAAGCARLLAGFALEDRGVARAGHALVADGAEVGVVTSGAPSPTLGKSIGLGYVPPALAAPGTRIDVRIRGRDVGARIVETPFVR
jgi:glycine cleavage system T protein (aminomethyltransferase)